MSWWHVGTAVGLTATGSLALLVWCLRGGSLVASALSFLPVWSNFDPLPVLDLVARDARDNDGRAPEHGSDADGDDAAEVVFQ